MVSYITYLWREVRGLNSRSLSAPSAFETVALPLCQLPMLIQDTTYFRMVSRFELDIRPMWTKLSEDIAACILNFGGSGEIRTHTSGFPDPRFSRPPPLGPSAYTSIFLVGSERLELSPLSGYGPQPYAATRLRHDPNYLVRPERFELPLDSLEESCLIH